MTTYSEQRVFPYPAQDIFNLIADVESYPEFLPYWRRAKIISRRGRTYRTEQEIGIGPVSETFVSKTVLNRPHQIVVTSSGKVFGTLVIEWRFETMPGGVCNVSFSQQHDARSYVVRSMLEVMFHDAARSTLRAFEKRAHDLMSPGAHGIGACA
jgi:coenzyme Q-binding protein COQ10